LSSELSNTVCNSFQLKGETDPLFFGVAGTNILGRFRAFRFFHREMEDVLEYDLTRLIYQLSDVNVKMLR